MCPAPSKEQAAGATVCCRKSSCVAHEDAPQKLGGSTKEGGMRRTAEKRAERRVEGNRSVLHR